MIDKYKEKNKILEFYKIYWECNNYIEYLNYESYISISMNKEYEEILNNWNSRSLMTLDSLNIEIDYL